MLGIGQRTAYNLLRQGKIQSVRMGRLYRVPKAAVIDYLYTKKRLEKSASPRYYRTTLGRR